MRLLKRNLMIVLPRYIIHNLVESCESSNHFYLSVIVDKTWKERRRESETPIEVEIFDFKS